MRCAAFPVQTSQALMTLACQAFDSDAEGQLLGAGFMVEQWSDEARIIPEVMNNRWRSMRC